MSYYISVIVTLFSIFPTWFSIFVLAFLTLVSIAIVFKVVSFALDAIPFL